MGIEIRRWGIQRQQGHPAIDVLTPNHYINIHSSNL